jgi:hypothetical protein
MSLYVLHAMLWILDVRGHIPQFDDYRPFPAEPSPAANPLVRTLTVLAVTVAFVALAIWAAVWLAIHLL